MIIFLPNFLSLFKYLIIFISIFQIRRFINSDFTENYDPTIEDHYDTSILYEGKKVHLKIIDTAGKVRIYEFSGHMKFLKYTRLELGGNPSDILNLLIYGAPF